MSAAVDEAQRSPRVPLMALAAAFLAVSLFGFGGVMARSADRGWAAASLTVAAAVVMLTTRLDPLWLLVAGGALIGDLAARAKVTPRRISPAGWSPERAPRRPKSTATSSFTCQIVPTSAERVAVATKSRS